MEKVIFPTTKADGERLEEVTGSHKQLWRYSVVLPAFSQVENKPEQGGLGWAGLPCFWSSFRDVLVSLPPSWLPVTSHILFNSYRQCGLRRRCRVRVQTLLPAQDRGESFLGCPDFPPWTPVKTSALLTPPGSCVNWHKTAYMSSRESIQLEGPAMINSSFHIKYPPGGGEGGGPPLEASVSLWKEATKPDGWLHSSSRSAEIWQMAVQFPLGICWEDPISVGCWGRAIRAFRSLWTNHHVSKTPPVSCVRVSGVLWYSSHIWFSSFLFCVEVRSNQVQIPDLPPTRWWNWVNLFKSSDVDFGVKRDESESQPCPES